MLLSLEVPVGKSGGKLPQPKPHQPAAQQTVLQAGSRHENIPQTERYSQLLNGSAWLYLPLVLVISESLLSFYPTFIKDLKRIIKTLLPVIFCIAVASKPLTKVVRKITSRFFGSVF